MTDHGAQLRWNGQLGANPSQGQIPTHPVNIPWGRKPEYPEKTLDLLYGRGLTLFQYFIQYFTQYFVMCRQQESNARSYRWTALALTILPAKLQHYLFRTCSNLLIILFFPVYQGLIRTCSHPVFLEEVCLVCLFLISHVCKIFAFDGYQLVGVIFRIGCSNPAIHVFLFPWQQP